MKYKKGDKVYIKKTGETGTVIDEVTWNLSKDLETYYAYLIKFSETRKRFYNSKDLESATLLNFDLICKNELFRNR